VDLSLTAKLIYSILLDRTSLSKKNGWIDDKGRVYIVFPIANIAQTIHKGMTVVKEALRELEEAGLIERKRHFSAPNTIYIKLPDGRKTDQRMAGKAAIVEPENRPSQGRKTVQRIVGKAAPNQTNNNQTDYNQLILARQQRPTAPPAAYAPMQGARGGMASLGSALDNGDRDAATEAARQKFLNSIKRPAWAAADAAPPDAVREDDKL
jgi:DNA-binding MarR family transcriptional regulator